MVDFGIDYTFWLNIVFGALAAYYVYVNLRNPMHHHGAGHDHAAHERHHGHDHHAHAASKQGGGAQHDGHAGHHDYSDARGERTEWASTRDISCRG